MNGKQWAASLAASCLVACQMISGLDDLEADRERMDAAVDAGDAASAGQGGRGGDAGGDDNDAGMPVAAGRSGSAAAGSGGQDAGRGGAGGMSGAGAGGMSGSGGAPVECKPPVSGGSCDPIAQCGCGDSENCVFYSGKLACVAEGTAGAYQRCADENDCTKGHQCVSGVCEKACASTAEMCSGDASRCRQIAFEDMPISGDYTCTRNCNPAHPQLDDARFDACGSGLGCTSYGEYSNCVTTSETGSSGKSCEIDADCAAGLYCSTQDLCEKWCEVGANDCGAGSTCHGFTTSKAHAGNAIEFGACCTPPAGKGPCDTAPQCGCPADQRCDIVIANGVSDGTTACLPIGPVAAFKACTTISDCGKGFTCSDGACKLLCDLSRSASCGYYSEYSKCGTVQVGGSDVPGWGVCSEVCNPAAPFKDDSRFTACVSGTTCRHFGEGETDCRRIPNPSTAIGTMGAACDDGAGGLDAARCAPGYFCDIATLKCFQYCEMGGDACASGGACQAFSPAARVATIALGYCE